MFQHPIGSMVLLYMVTWIPSIYPLYVSIYTSTMDPMGMFQHVSICFNPTVQIGWSNLVGWGWMVESSRSTDCRLNRLHKRCMGARHAHVSCLVLFGLTWRKISKTRAIYAKQTHQHLQYLHARETSTTGNGRKLPNFRRIFTYGLFQLKIHLQRPGGINLSLTKSDLKKQGMPGMHTPGQWQECLQYVLGVVLCCNQFWIKPWKHIGALQMSWLPPLQSPAKFWHNA